jgi:hypothetical protein
MLFWLAGAVIALAGTMVYVEFGLAIPRLHGESIPRNGGEKNYVSVSGKLALYRGGTNQCPDRVYVQQAEQCRPERQSR